MSVPLHPHNHDVQVGNSVCRQIPWDANKEKLAAWAEARTGFPWIDAIMTQVKFLLWRKDEYA